MIYVHMWYGGLCAAPLSKLGAGPASNSDSLRGRLLGGAGAGVMRHFNRSSSRSSYTTINRYHCSVLLKSRTAMALRNGSNVRAPGQKSGVKA